MSKKHSVKDYSIVFAGQHLSGFGPDSFFSVDFDGEGYTKTVGSDGEVAFNEDADESGVVTIQLLQTSSSNEFLSQIYQSAREGGQLHQDLLIRDANGKTSYSSADAVVKRVPNTSRGKEVGVNEWQIICGHIKAVEGGTEGGEE